MAVVRIDDELLKKIKEYLDTNTNRYRYPSLSAFINNVIYEKLNKINSKKRR